MATTWNYAYTGGVQSLVVPAGVYGLLVKLWGAVGGEGGTDPGGLGGYTEGNLAVTPGQTVYIYCGGSATGSGHKTGGFNGGGNGGSPSYSAGGGATDIRVGGTALANRVGVAGGGAGVTGLGSGDNPGVGGGLVGGNGSGASPGLGGTQLAGGAAGGGGFATAGTLGVGGNAGSPGISGGGGGYYGGGGGYNGGGGGGSAYYGGLTGAGSTSGIWGGTGKASLTVSSQIPNAPILTSPIGNSYIAASAINVFTWSHSADTAQAQTAYDLRYRVIGAGSWTTVSATTTDQFRSIAASTFTAGSDYEWQARTTNAAGVGPYSSSAFFRAATPPTAPVITAPALDSDVETGDNITWTVTNQTYYQFRRVANAGGSPNTAVVYEDSGTVVESGTRSRPLMFTVNNRVEHLQVRVFYNTLWSSWTSRRINALATRPLDPVVYLTADQDTASIDVHWSTPTPGVGDVVVAYNEVWVIDFDQWVRVATNLPASGTVTYWTPRSGEDYDLRVRVVAVGVDGTTSEGIPSGAIGTPYGAGLYGVGPYGG